MDHGRQFYRIKRSIDGSEIMTVRHPFSGEVTGSLTAEDLKKNHPALNRFDLPTIDTEGP